MKVYTIENPGRVVRGIALHDGAIHVGYHPIHGKPVTIGPDARATVEDGRLVESPGKGALLLIEPHAGAFGSWHIRAAQPAERWDAMVAAGYIPNALDRILAQERVRARFPHRPPVGWYEFTRASQGTDDVSARCIRLFGYLEEGAAFEIRRRGRLEGTPSVFRVACTSGTLMVSDPCAMAEQRRAASFASQGGRSCP
jgi:hypothetical protein